VKLHSKVLAPLRSKNLGIIDGCCAEMFRWIELLHALFAKEPVPPVLKIHSME
jgi:hypothetical protein